jgi:hypothetical protein
LIPDPDLNITTSIITFDSTCIAGDNSLPISSSVGFQEHLFPPNPIIHIQPNTAEIEPSSFGRNSQECRDSPETWTRSISAILLADFFSFFDSTTTLQPPSATQVYSI